MWEERELEGIEFIPEPSDSRILSAADSTTIGHQEGWRAEVLGWAPDPVHVIPRRSRAPQRITNVGIMLLMLLVVWGMWNSQFLYLDVPPPTSEWAFEDTGIRDLQDLGLDGTGVRVCMVDTGIDASHPDFATADIVFKDFLTGSTEPIDHGGLAHGTMMAGILVADGHMKGAAPGVTVGMAAALGDDGDGTNSGEETLVADAIEWCWREFNADIISLSLGGINNPNASREGPTTSAVRQAINQGVFIVAAAGNDGGADDDGRVASPSNVEEVISVGALMKDGTLWEGSSKGSQIDNEDNPRADPHLKPEVSAPGHDIISTGSDGLYYTSTGTSDSTVFVAGALALIIEAEPTLKQVGPACMEMVKQALQMSSNPLENEVSHDEYWGYGSLNADIWLEEIRAAGACA